MGPRFVALGAWLLIGCKGAPAEPPPGDGGNSFRGPSDGASQSVASATPAATVTGPLNSRLAESEGMRLAYQRWGYRPREATAWHMPSGGWRVTVMFEEPNVTANLFFSGDGKVLDSGVFGETDR